MPSFLLEAIVLNSEWRYFSTLPPFLFQSHKIPFILLSDVDSLLFLKTIKFDNMIVTTLFCPKCCLSHLLQNWQAMKWRWERISTKLCWSILAVSVLTAKVNKTLFVRICKKLSSFMTTRRQLLNYSPSIPDRISGLLDWLTCHLAHFVEGTLFFTRKVMKCCRTENSNIDHGLWVPQNSSNSSIYSLTSSSGCYYYLSCN